MNMDSEQDKLPFPVKAAVLVVVAVFAVIGVVGLILPIIPGILFLALAAYLLARVSSRFAFYLDQQPTWMKLRRHWRSQRLLTMTQRLKLAGLYCARAAIDGMDALFRKLTRRSSPGR